MRNEKWLTRLCCVALFLISHCLFLTSCTKDNICDTPFGTGGTFNTLLPEYSALQTVGGTKIILLDQLGFEVGYRGIFVRRISFGEFLAFECACPNCHDVRLEPLEGWDGDVLECPDCHSCYETINGQPLEGAASGCPLYQYYTQYDGVFLEIY